MPQAILKFAAYCGMTTIQEHGDLADMRREVAKILKRRRKTEHPVYVSEPGREWEVSEPDDCAMIPDTAGILRLTELADNQEPYEDGNGMLRVREVAEEEEEEPSGGDLCDLCMTSHVTVERTTACGLTIGIECGCNATNDGTCGKPDCEECKRASEEDGDEQEPSLSC